MRVKEAYGRGGTSTVRHLWITFILTHDFILYTTDNFLCTSFFTFVHNDTCNSGCFLLDTYPTEFYWWNTQLLPHLVPRHLGCFQCRLKQGSGNTTHMPIHSHACGSLPASGSRLLGLQRYRLWSIPHQLLTATWLSKLAGVNDISTRTAGASTSRAAQASNSHTMQREHIWGYTTVHLSFLTFLDQKIFPKYI